VHHKGRKKTTDAETGTAVGSVSLVAMQEKMAQKKPMEVGPNFYRHQKREAHMTGMSKNIYRFPLLSLMQFQLLLVVSTCMMH
jgi:hypothetical protein